MNLEKDHNSSLHPYKILTVEKVSPKGRVTGDDYIAEELPLQIYLRYGPLSDRILRAYAVIMRTPGHDSELIMGNLFCEGIIKKSHDILDFTFNKQGKDDTYLITEAIVDLQPSVTVNLPERHLIAYGSCGLCSRSTLNGYLDQFEFLIPKKGLRLDNFGVYALSKHLNQVDSLFSRTGGVHSCALLNAEGELIDHAEDIGRHNALDKMIGSQLEKMRLPLHHFILQLSGRISFELVQKAAMSGIPIIVAFGAPSSGAIDLADQLNITLIGFLKSQSYTIYTHTYRIQ